MSIFLPRLTQFHGIFVISKGCLNYTQGEVHFSYSLGRNWSVLIRLVPASSYRLISASFKIWRDQKLWAFTYHREGLRKAYGYMSKPRSVPSWLPQLKTKVAKAVNNEAKAMVHAIKSNRWSFSVSESLYGCAFTFGFAWGVSFLIALSSQVWASCSTLDSIWKDILSCPTSFLRSIIASYDCAGFERDFL